jgi:hypothetical protein
MTRDEGEWRWETETQYVLVQGDHYVRAINVRGPYINEPPGTKYCVSGDGHEASIHPSLEEARDAATASL